MPALILAAALAMTPPTASQPTCRAAGPIPASRSSTDRPSRLGELPPGAMYRAVLRTAAGCDLVEVRQDGRWSLRPSGAPAHAAPARLRTR